jgi:hypothetical protein
MKTLSNYEKILLGYNNNEPIYLSPPSWDCGWYWGFGYLGNKNCHYHVDGLTKIQSQDFLTIGLVTHIGLNLTLEIGEVISFGISTMTPK